MKVLLPMKVDFLNINDSQWLNVIYFPLPLYTKVKKRKLFSFLFVSVNGTIFSNAAKTLKETGEKTGAGRGEHDQTFTTSQHRQQTQLSLNVLSAVNHKKSASHNQRSRVYSAGVLGGRLDLKLSAFSFTCHFFSHLQVLSFSYFFLKAFFF